MLGNLIFLILWPDQILNPYSSNAIISSEKSNRLSEIDFFSRNDHPQMERRWQIRRCHGQRELYSRPSDSKNRVSVRGCRGSCAVLGERARWRRRSRSRRTEGRGAEGNFFRSWHKIHLHNPSAVRDARRQAKTISRDVTDVGVAPRSKLLSVVSPRFWGGFVALNISRRRGIGETRVNRDQSSVF